MLRYPSHEELMLKEEEDEAIRSVLEFVRRTYCCKDSSQQMKIHQDLVFVPSL